MRGWGRRAGRHGAFTVEEAQMKKWVVAVSIVLAAVVTAAFAQSTRAADEDRAALIKRGEYIANGVAMCVICHSPKDAKGNVLPGQHFLGDTIPAAPTHPELGRWASRAPALKNLAVGAEADVIKLLQTGIWPRTGLPPQRPMPPFKLSEEDARAVVYYLQTI
jgi:mono/diheme cytochrome c family protein